MTAPTGPEAQPRPAASAVAGPTRREDAAHAARSGLSQIVAMLGHGLLPVHRMLVSRLFGQSAYGVYRASADLCEVLTRAGMAGADKAMLRFVSAHRVAGETRQEAEALGSGLRLAGGTLAVLALALAAAAPLFVRLWGKPDYGWVLPLLAPSIVGGGLVVVLVMATLAAKVTRVNLLVRGGAEPILLLITTLIAWLVYPTLGGVAVAHMVAYLLLLVLAWVGTSAVLGPGRLRTALRAPPHPGLVRFAVPIAGSELMNAILQRASIFVLSAYSGAPTVAVFAAAEELGRAVVSVRTAFDSIASPMMSEALKLGDRERLRYNLALITRWVASAATPIAFTLLALRHELLQLYGPGYQGGAAAMSLLVAGHLVNAVLGLTPYVIVMSGRANLFFWNNLCSAALNMGLSLALIPRYGLVGAAVASLVSVTALQGVMCVQVYVTERVHPFEWALLKPFIAAALALAGQLAVARLQVPALARVALVIATGLVIYPVALLVLRPGEEERRLVLGLARRLFRGRGEQGERR